MTDFVAELRSLRTQAFRRLLHNADFRVLLALDRALADLEDPATGLSGVAEDDVMPALRSAEPITASDQSAINAAEIAQDVDQDIFAEEARSAEEAQLLLEEVERARAGAIAAHRAVMETGRDIDGDTATAVQHETDDGDETLHLNGHGGSTVDDADPLTSIFTGPMPETSAAVDDDGPIERLTPRNDAYEAALNRLNTLIERASNQLRATSG